MIRQLQMPETILQKQPMKVRGTNMTDDVAKPRFLAKENYFV